MSHSEPAALQLEHVSKRYGSIVAVDDVSLEIYEGEVFTFLGPSGCGKTTCLRIIAGLERPDKGRVRLHGRMTSSAEQGIFVPPEKRDLGMVFQSLAIWPHKDVFENVAYPLQVRHVKDPEVRQRVLRTLALVGLQGYESRPSAALSGGEQQRVALARAIVHEPHVLLLDEPFSSLDAKLREQMRVEVRQLLRRAKVTAVFVTHDQTEAVSLSDRMAVMSTGRLEQVGTPFEVYRCPRTPFVRDFLGKSIVLQGRVKCLQPEEVVVEVVGLSVDLRATRITALPLEVGSAVAVTMRPEDLLLSPAQASPASPAAGVNELAARVVHLVFMGDHYACRMQLHNGIAFTMYQALSTSLRADEVVRLSISPERVSLWRQERTETQRQRPLEAGIGG